MHAHEQDFIRRTQIIGRVALTATTTAVRNVGI